MDPAQFSSQGAANGSPAAHRFATRLAYRKLKGLLGRGGSDEAPRQSMQSDSSSEAIHAAASKTLYEDLGKRDIIRLLKLDPESTLSPLGYTVRTFALAKAPKYHALSYCWGSPDRTCSIACNGFRLLISTHLKQGLAELASVPELTGKWFWIDQICVNQDDPAERSHQVVLMRRIYTQTQRTVIWLGPSGGGDHAAGFRLAKNIYDLCQSNPSTHKQVGMRAKFPPKKFLKTAREVSSLRLPRMSTESGLAPCWAELAVLLGKPWFGRMWILQEAVLARTTPMLVYAHQSRSWMHVIVAGAWVGQSGPAVRKELGLGVQQINCILFLASIWLTRNKWAVAALLRLTLHNQASDPRDRVFALLNLCDEGHRPEKVHALLQPDYAKPLQHVYRDAVAFTLTKESARPLPLQLVNYRPGVSQGPSWVPEFHHAVPFINAISIDHSNGGANSYVRGLQASMLDASIRHNPASPDTLNIRGVPVTRVDWTTERCHSEAAGKSSQSIPGVEQILFWVQQTSRHLFGRPGSPQKSAYRSIHEFVEAVLGLLQVQNYDMTLPRRQALKLWCDLESTYNNTAARRYWKREDYLYQDFLTGLEPFRFPSGKMVLTEEGKVGIVPEQVEPRDEIVIFPRGDAPFVLRPRLGQSSHVLLGECCVDGWMHREADDEVRNGTLQYRNFQLD